MPAITFANVLEKIRDLAPYVEDVCDLDSVVAILTLQLTNTDCLPAQKKAGSGSKSTQIELTDSPNAHPSKTDDFFPILHRSQVFPSDQLSIQTDLVDANIAALEKSKFPGPASLLSDRLTIQHRAPLNETKNPSVHLGYDGELLPLRSLVSIGDFIVFLRSRQSPHFIALGFRKDSPLPENKNIYVSELVQKSVKTRFVLGTIGTSSVGALTSEWWVSPVPSDPPGLRATRLWLDHKDAMPLRIGDRIILHHDGDGGRTAHGYGTVAGLRDEGERTCVQLHEVTRLDPFVAITEAES